MNAWTLFNYYLNVIKSLFLRNMILNITLINLPLY